MHFINYQNVTENWPEPHCKIPRKVTQKPSLLSCHHPCRLPIVHTLEAHLPSLADCPPAKLRRCPAIGTTLDAARGRVLVAGEPGNGIVEAVAPLAGELLLHKPGKGAFWATRGDFTDLFAPESTELSGQPNL